MNFSTRCLAALSLACATVSPLQAGNLVKNGSFEKPVVPDGGFQGFSAGSSFDSWTVAGAGAVAIFSENYEQGSFTFPASKGHQWLDLTGAGSNSKTGVAQDIQTSPGKTYSLTMYVGNTYGPNDGLGTKSTVDVLIDGEAVASFTNKLGKKQGTIEVWKKFSTDFVAQGTTTTIAFFNGDPADDGNNGIDNVSVTLAKAP